MSRTLSKITDEALSLPQHEQLHLARVLLEKSESVGDLDVEAAWDDEIERRIKLLDAGLAKGISFADVLKEVEPSIGPMTLIVVEEAQNEFIETAAYYEHKEPGLGTRFRDDVAAVVDWIRGHPDVPRLRSRGYRRVNLRIFSHYVAYVLRGETIWIVAIAHAHQRPEFWIRRIV